MAGVGKIVAAAASVQLENTNALAQLNFDFSLFRVEAPPEFKKLGASLSTSRVREAENGRCHVTARKLAALFEDVIPITPHLVSAYGTRVSQIVESPKQNPKGDSKSGLLAEQIGADGTTIWAAATSGKAAIAVHLLACMLARMWPGPQAISVWVEIVTERKRILSGNIQDGLHVFTAAGASQIELSRDQLANWDASARAWLEIADDAMEFKQKQLTLIIDNLGLPVSQNRAVYPSVVNTWRAALEAVDLLISGAPHNIQDAAPLLGLSAWHIYPDMLYVGKSSTLIKQHDPLVALGGLLTLGIKAVSPSQNGIYWSLPLSHLYFYGDPVVASAAVSLDSSRVSIDQFLLVCMGSLTQAWRNSAVQSDLSFDGVARITLMLSKRLDMESTSSWLGALGDAAKDYLTSTTVHRAQCLQLIKVGARRHSNYLTGAYGSVPALYGLNDVNVMLSMITNTDQRIQFLRRWIALNPRFTGRILVIQYRHRIFSMDDPTKYTDIRECASVATKQKTSSRKRGHEAMELGMDPRGKSETSSSDVGSRISLAIHRISSLKPTRWISYEDYGNPDARVSELESKGENVRIIGASYIPSFKHRRCVIKNDQDIDRLEDILFGAPKDDAGDDQGFESTLWRTSRDDSPDSKLDEDLENDLIMQETTMLDTHSRPCGEQQYQGQAEFALVAGDPNDVALYLVEPVISADSRSLRSLEHLVGAVPLNDMASLLEHALVNEDIDQQYLLDTLSFERASRDSKSLKALATVTSIYRNLPQAKINLGAMRTRLYDSEWIPSTHDDDIEPSSVLAPYNLDLAETFACICMFESGTFNLEPRAFGNIIAVSSGNSIYLPTTLVSDPTPQTTTFVITHVIGNLGRPGMTLLIPPARPRIRNLPDETWNQINHHPFEGHGEDNFQGSSLHLKLLTWESAVLLKTHHGLQDNPARFLEATVSLIDRGEWVADLNITEALTNRKIICLRPCRGHSGSQNSAHNDIANQPALISIDTWNELLDSPLEAGILRAKGNWQARLAALTLSYQLGHHTIALPEDPCWQCVTEMQREQDPTRKSVHRDESHETGDASISNAWELGLTQKVSPMDYIPLEHILADSDMYCDPGAPAPQGVSTPNEHSAQTGKRATTIYIW